MPVSANTDIFYHKLTISCRIPTAVSTVSTFLTTILRFFIVVPLAFVIYPAIFLAAGIYTGRDLKRRWHIAILQVLFCIISEFKFPSGWLIYIAVELLSLIITLIIMKRCKNKADKKENHNV